MRDRSQAIIEGVVFAYECEDIDSSLPECVSCIADFEVRFGGPFGGGTITGWDVHQWDRVRNDAIATQELVDDPDPQWEKSLENWIRANESLLLDKALDELDKEHGY